MVYPADRIVEIREAKKFGITAEIRDVDFGAIMDQMRSSVKKSHDSIKESLKNPEDFDFYFGEASFTDDYTIEVNGQLIKGKSIFIVTGARPHIPPIKGIDTISYLTNESALQLTKRPDSMIIIGGGYIAAELAHFFEAMGTKVTIVQRNSRLVPDEEPEVSDLLKKALSRRMQILTATEAVKVSKSETGIIVMTRSAGGKHAELTASHLLIAAGRTSNADLLHVDRTGVKTDMRGYIEVDDYFETSKKDIWSFGDAIGKKMFRHSANRESELAWHNAVHEKKSRMNYLTVPHAVFSYPEIASVGLTEKQAVTMVGKQEVLVGMALYNETARGEAMRENEGFTKAIVHRKSGNILGYHIIGPQASILIQEVVNAMEANGNLWSVAKGMHIHPALPEVVLKAFGKLREPA